MQQPSAAQTMYQGLPDVVNFAQNAPVNPGDSTSFAGVATVTIGGDHTRITDTHNSITGDGQTMVRDKFGALVSVKTSEIVPGTGGLTRDATIVDRLGVSQVRIVDDGYGNRITWTANPDGSHSVHYSSTNIIVVEPAPGSSLPAQIIQLSPDGQSGHVIMSHSNGETSTADFGPGVFGAPVTKYTRSDGTSVEVLTVPGRTKSQPVSIVNDAMGNRAVVQPDGTTTPVDRYNTAIGGPSYGNKFDPSNATWIPDPITSRGPMVRVPDGTSIQKWHGRKPDGSKYEFDAYFDEQGNLRGIGGGDSTGIKYTSYSSIDGIYVPTDTINLDAGNAIDNRQLVYDAVMIAFGVPELAFLGTRLGVGLGSRYFGSRLAGQGASLTGRELAIAGLGAGDALTGLTGGATAAKNLTLPSSTPQVRRPPVPAVPSARPPLTNARQNRPAAPSSGHPVRHPIETNSRSSVANGLKPFPSGHSPRGYSWQSVAGPAQASGARPFASMLRGQLEIIGATQSFPRSLNLPAGFRQISGKIANAVRLTGPPNLLRGAPDPSNIFQLERRTKNIGSFAELSVPMQKKSVVEAARRAGVLLDGVNVKIIRDPELIGRGLYGHTPNGRQITLYPDAFTDMETLVVTIGHERTHVFQWRLYGRKPTNSLEGDAWERAAYAVEDQFWAYYKGVKLR
ncbi:hypothetical protein [Nocardia sp. XZ_19_231]|uniref:hypothetical protein n=1 Tax=Nocardia sp. XZ_19_231 TaxID=2769252 RepID=UPI00188E9658|nr:hypothetical protein [Nocardia sp. XZ_19_231]